MPEVVKGVRTTHNVISPSTQAAESRKIAVEKEAAAEPAAAETKTIQTKKGPRTFKVQKGAPKPPGAPTA